MPLYLEASGTPSDREVSITLLPESWTYVLSSLSIAGMIPVANMPLDKATLKRIAQEIERQMEQEGKTTDLDRLRKANQRNAPD